MKVSELEADKELQSLLYHMVKIGEDTPTNVNYVTVYRDGDRPTNDVPDEFIEITYNGYAESLTDPLGAVKGNLSVTLYCKLFSDGTVKLNRVKKLLQQFETKCDKVASDNFFFKFDLQQFITPTRADLTSGYSITELNVIYRSKNIS